MRQDVAKQQGHAEAAWRHALRVQPTSEHLIEFRHDKISAAFLTFLSLPPTRSSAGVHVPVWFKGDERGATECVED